MSDREWRGHMLVRTASAEVTCGVSRGVARLLENKQGVVMSHKVRQGVVRLHLGPTGSSKINKVE